MYKNSISKFLQPSGAAKLPWIKVRARATSEPPCRPLLQLDTDRPTPGAGTWAWGEPLQFLYPPSPRRRRQQHLSRIGDNHVLAISRTDGCPNICSGGNSRA